MCHKLHLHPFGWLFPKQRIILSF